MGSTILRRLGRKAPRPASARFLMLDLKRHVDGLPKVPDAIDLTSPWAPLFLGHNDEVRDCGVAGIANGLSTEARQEGREPAFLSRATINDDIRDFYFRYTGGKDEGVVLLDFLHYVKSQPDGFLGEKVGEPIAIDPKNWEEVTVALALGYGLYIGATMTQATLEAEAGTFWRNEVGDQTEVGGHCMYASGFVHGDKQSFGEPNLSLETWGERSYCTKSWWDKHVDEAYILVDLSRPNGCFNLETLRADLAVMYPRMAAQ